MRFSLLHWRWLAAGSCLLLFTGCPKSRSTPSSAGGESVVVVHPPVAPGNAVKNPIDEPPVVYHPPGPTPIPTATAIPDSGGGNSPTPTAAPGDPNDLETPTPTPTPGNANDVATPTPTPTPVIGFERGAAFPLTGEPEAPVQTVIYNGTSI